MIERNPIRAAVQLALEMDGDEPVEDLLGLERTAARVRERAAGLTNAGRGRPPGARNRTTQDWLRYFTHKYNSPLEILAQMAGAPVDELARELCCTRLDAFREKRHAAEALAPYLHPRLQSIELFPAGHPRGGIASTLTLVPQELTDTFTETIEAETSETKDLEAAVSMFGSAGTERDDNAVDQALDELAERARRDPEMVQRIRALLERPE